MDFYATSAQEKCAIPHLDGEFEDIFQAIISNHIYKSLVRAFPFGGLFFYALVLMKKAGCFSCKTQQGPRLKPHVKN